VSADRCDDVSGALAEFSPNGIEEIMKQDGACELRAFFSEDAPVNRHEENLRSAFPSAQLNSSYCEWDPHDESWRQHFAPYEIAPGIIIAPSWEHYKAKGDEQVITLDPGMAFGTGLHPTTRMCAGAVYDFALSSRAKSRDPLPFNALKARDSSTRSLRSLGRNDSNEGASRSLLDVGCGSGILMLVAERSGYSDIIGVEIDEDAAHVARENCELNGMPNAKVLGEISEVKEQYDVVVANILLTTLLTLRDDIARISRPGTTLILSGITADQVDEIIECYGKYFELNDVKDMEEWRCLVMERNE
jgi:ribosomal protein L11 methyltransferase